MFSEAVIEPSLIQAFLETDFRVQGDQPFTLHIGTISADLLAEHIRHGVDCSAFLTACNPYSHQVENSENDQRQIAMSEEFTKLGLVTLPGVGQHPSNGWPGEDSFLVLGLNLEAAKSLGKRFEQNAIVWSGADGVPQLILLK